MKAKYTILIIALGFCLDYIGSLMKIMHRYDANTVLTIGAVLKVLGLLLFVFKIIRYEGFKKFMER